MRHNERSDRRTFNYAVNVHGLDIEGTYVADCGQLDTLDLPDGTTVALGFDCKAIDKGQGQDALALAGMIARRIVACVNHQNDMAQTARYESWASHAPVVL